MHVICIPLVGKPCKILRCRNVFVGCGPSRKRGLMDVSFQDIGKIVYASMLKDPASIEFFTFNKNTIDKRWIFLRCLPLSSFSSFMTFNNANVSFSHFCQLNTYNNKKYLEIICQISLKCIHVYIFGNVDTLNACGYAYQNIYVISRSYRC